MLQLKNTKIESFDDLFNLMKNKKQILSFFFNDNLKNYKKILEEILNKKKHRDGDYYYFENQLKFYKNIKDNEYYYSPYWIKDESFEKFEKAFNNLIYQKSKNSNKYDNFINDFNFSTSFKKLNKVSNLELFYLNEEIYNYPIIFNYNFLPKINTKNQISELNFYKYFYKKYKDKIDKEKIFKGKNNLTLFQYKKKEGVNEILDNFILFNSNLINTFNEYIIFNTENLKEDKLYVFDFNENNIYLNNNENKDNYYDSILPIFKINLSVKKFLINKNECKFYDSCFFSKLFEEENIIDFDFIIKYFNIYFLFYEAKLFEFKYFFDDLKSLVEVFSSENEDFTTDNKNVNILINKILFEFDLDNLKKIKIKIKYLLGPIIQFFSDKINSNDEKKKEKKTLRSYFENNYKKFKKTSFKDFFIDKELKNFKNYGFIENLKVIKKDHEFNYFILYDIVYKTFTNSYNNEKNSFFKSFIYSIKDKKSQLKLLGKDIINLFSIKSSFKDKFEVIKKNMEFVIEIFQGFHFIFNITKTIINSSIVEILRVVETGLEDIKDFVSKVKVSKIIFKNFNDYTNSLYNIIYDVDLDKYIELKKQRLNNILKIRPGNNIKKSNAKISFRNLKN